MKSLYLDPRNRKLMGGLPTIFFVLIGVLIFIYNMLSFTIKWGN
jgi:hypothetical protein